MSDQVWLLRHGDTEWTEEGRHAGRLDVGLNADGRDQAQAAGRLLAGHSFDHVIVSPQLRAVQTCALAGFGGASKACPGLVEWDYGDFTGATDDEAEALAPGWNPFRDGAPGGESPADVEARIDRVLAALERLEGTCLLVGHGRSLRVLAARWLGFDATFARVLRFDPGAIAQLERDSSGPRLGLWNGSPDLLGTLTRSQPRTGSSASR